MIRLVCLCLLPILCFTHCKKDEPEVPIGIGDKTLLVASNKTGTFQIYQLRASVETQLTNDENYHYWWPKASPDRSKFLAYRSPINAEKRYNNYEEAELMLFNIDGSNPVQLLGEDPYIWSAHGMARWSPDGELIVMAAKLVVDLSGDEQWRLFVTDKRGQEPSQISDKQAYDPNWSHDGNKIVFSDLATTGNNQIYPLAIDLFFGDFNTTTIQLNNITQITNSTARDQNAVFSPNDQQIAFATDEENFDSPNIKIIDIDGRNKQDIAVDFRANGGSIVWSDDGEYLFFQSKASHVFIRKIKKNGERVEEIILEASDQSYDYLHPDLY